MDSKILVVCRLQNAVRPDNALPDGQVELVLDDILTPHEMVKGRKSVFVPRYVANSEERFLVSLEANKGVLSALQGHSVDDKREIVKFIRGGVQLKDKSSLGRIRYSVDFLRSPNPDVADSAHLQLRQASYADLRKVAETRKPEPLSKALQDDKTPKNHLGTFGILLGHCGKKEHAVLLRKLIDAHSPVGRSRLDDLMFGYVLLDQENGWDFVAKTAVEKKKSFLFRYDAYRTMRRIGEDRPDLVGIKKCAAGIARILDVPDMADFACETLRRWQRWEYCDAVLDLEGKAGFDAPLIRHAVLRFALECPSPAAKTFVVVERAIDPDRVSEAEEILALEK